MSWGASLHECPCNSLTFTFLPQMQVCGWHVTDPRRHPTSTCMASSESLSLTAVIGGSLSQSPACGAPAAFILATSVVGVSQFGIVMKNNFFWNKQVITIFEILYYYSVTTCLK